MNKHIRIRELFILAMRVVLVQVIIAASLSVSTYGNKLTGQDLLDKRISLSVKNKDAKTVLHMIERKAAVKFTYQPHVIQNESDFTFDYKDISLNEILNVMFESKVKYIVIGNQIVLRMVSKDQTYLNPTENDQLQAYTFFQVSGTVKDENGEVLPGVNVLIKGSTIGTTTDFSGKYTIDVTDQTTVLIFSFIGYIKEEVEVGNQTQIDVMLTPDLTTLEEIVVVGYGTQEKANLTGAVTTLDTKEISNRPITQTSQALQGKMAGVTVTQNFGKPGDDAGTVRIRGIGSITPQGSTDQSKLEPLVLIDGVQGSLNEINPKDIDKITVLKDAASASIYGSRAANGVIIVTTKRGGKNEAMTITYSGLMGAQLPTYLPEPVDGLDHMLLTNEKAANQGRVAIFSPDQIQNYKDSVGFEGYNNTDWYDVAMKDYAMQYQHNLTMRGGTEKISALVSLSTLTQDALIKSTQYDRKTLRFNTDYRASEKLRISLDGSLYLHKQRFPTKGEGPIFEMMAEIPRIQTAVWPDGVWGEGWNGDNPLGYLNEGGSSTRTNSRIVLNLNASYEFTDWLSVEVRYSPKYLSNYNKSMVQKYAFRRDGGSMGITPSGNNSLKNEYRRTLENFYQALGRINKDFDKHSFALIAGFEALDNRLENFDASRSNFPLEDYQILSGGDPNLKDNNGDATEFALLSYLGRINYSYDGKYLLEANLRYDGSSRFSPDNRWSFFPSFSAGWRISEEQFMQGSSLFTNLKLRASWGRLGNQNVGSNYPYLGLISVNTPVKTVPYFFGKSVVNAAAQTVLPNPGITWETTEDLNFGLDFGILKNKLSGSLDLYKRNTFNILYQRPIPAIIGLNPTEQNIAEVENLGWDLQLSWDNNTGDLSYGVDVVLSDVHNKVVYLKDTPIYGLNAVIEGEEYNAYYGYESLGLYRSAEDVANYPALNPSVGLGDIIFKDVSGNDILESGNEDKKVIGSSIPRFNFGVTLRLAYHNFDFSMFMQGVGKKDLYYNVYSARFGGTFYTYQLDDRFVPDDESTWASASLPRLMDNSHVNNNISSFYLYNAAYARCKYIVLGYNVPEVFAQKINLNSLRVYVTGQNLFTIDGLKINTIDPEAPDTDGFGTSYYPNTKTIAIGVDVRF